MTVFVPLVSHGAIFTFAAPVPVTLSPLGVPGQVLLGLVGPLTLFHQLSVASMLAWLESFSMPTPGDGGSKLFVLIAPTFVAVASIPTPTALLEKRLFVTVVPPTLRIR